MTENSDRDRDHNQKQEHQVAESGSPRGGSLIQDSRITRRPLLKTLVAAPILAEFATDAKADMIQDSGGEFTDDFEDESLQEYVAEYGEKSDWSVDKALDNHATLGSISAGTSFLKLDPDKYSWGGDRTVNIDFKADTSNWKRNARILLKDGEDAYIVNAAIQGNAISLSYDKGTNGDWEGIESANHYISDGGRHTLSADVNGDTCIISLDGEEVISPTLKSELGDGSVGFGVKGDIPVGTWFDNLAVEGSLSDGGQEGPNVEITNMQVEPGPYSLEDPISAQVTVENTRDSEDSVFVGYSATPNGSNESYDNDGSTGETVTIASEGSESIELTLTLPNDAPTGNYTLISSVWAESDRDNLETQLDTEDQQITINNEETEDYLSGSVVDINGDPVQNVYVEAYYRAGSAEESEGTVIESGAQFIAGARTDDGVFEFDGSEGGIALPRSSVEEKRSEFAVGEGSGVTIIAQEMPPSESSMTTGNPWFQGMSLESGEFFNPDFNQEIRLQHQQLFRRTVGSESSNNLNSKVFVYRKISTENHGKQWLNIEIRGAGEVGIISDGICAFRIPEDLNVGYGDIEHGVWRSGSVETYPFALSELMRMGSFRNIPLFPATRDIAFGQVTETTGEVSEIWSKAFSGIIGLVPLHGANTAVGFVNTMSGILGEEREPEEVIGEMSNFDPNTQDLVKGNWPSNLDQVCINFQIPIEFSGESEHTFEARAVWKAHVRGFDSTVSNVLSQEFPLSSNVNLPGN